MPLLGKKDVKNLVSCLDYRVVCFQLPFEAGREVAQLLFARGGIRLLRGRLHGLEFGNVVLEVVVLSAYGLGCLLVGKILRVLRLEQRVHAEQLVALDL